MLSRVRKRKSNEPEPLPKRNDDIKDEVGSLYGDIHLDQVDLENEQAVVFLSSLDELEHEYTWIKDDKTELRRHVRTLRGLEHRVAALLQRARARLQR